MAAAPKPKTTTKTTTFGSSAPVELELNEELARLGLEWWSPKKLKPFLQAKEELDEEGTLEDKYVFYDAPPSNKDYVLNTFALGFNKLHKSAIQVFMDHRHFRLPDEFLKEPYNILVGVYVPFPNIVDVNIRFINSAYKTHMRDCGLFISDDRSMKEGEFVYAKETAYCGQYFPYVLGGKHANVVQGIVDEDKTDLTGLLTYSGYLSDEHGDKIAEFFPTRDIPFAGKVNEPWDEEKGWSPPNMSYRHEMPFFPNPEHPPIKNILVFPSMIIEAPCVSKDEHCTVYYGDAYDRTQYPGSPKPSQFHEPEYTLEVIVNRVFWKDKWHIELCYCTEHIGQAIKGVQQLLPTESKKEGHTFFTVARELGMTDIAAMTTLLNTFVCSARPGWEFQPFLFEKETVVFPERLKVILRLWQLAQLKLDKPRASFSSHRPHDHGVTPV